MKYLILILSLFTLANAQPAYTLESTETIYGLIDDKTTHPHVLIVLHLQIIRDNAFSLLQDYHLNNGIWGVEALQIDEIEANVMQIAHICSDQPDPRCTHLLAHLMDYVERYQYAKSPHDNAYITSELLTFIGYE